MDSSVIKQVQERWGRDDFHSYDNYLKSWATDKTQEYRDYIDDATADGERIMSFMEWLDALGYEPQDIYDYGRELDEDARVHAAEHRADLEADGWLG